MNYFDEGFNAYLNGEKPTDTAKRLAVNYSKNTKEVQDMLAGHHTAAQMDRATRPE